jgi:polyhydroxybutyrate depolymerase
MPSTRSLAHSLLVALAASGSAACGGDSSPTPPDDGPARITTPGFHLRTLEVDGVPRRYRVYLPSSVDPERPAPMVAVLHGFPPIDMAPVSRMDSEAAARGFVAVYPESAYGEDWVQACNCTPNGLRGVNDLMYFAALLEDLSAALSIDPDRRYLAGFSNGGMMTYRVLCDRPSLFDGFAAVGSVVWKWHVDHCGSGPAGSLLMIHGTEDPSFPWDGASIELVTGAFVDQLPAEEHVAWWAARNGCEPGGNEVALPDQVADGTRAFRRDWEGCGAPTRFIRIEGGGHTWPGTAVTFHPSLGLRSDEVDATSEMLDFWLGG